MGFPHRLLSVSFVSVTTNLSVQIQSCISGSIQWFRASFCVCPINVSVLFFLLVLRIQYVPRHGHTSVRLLGDLPNILPNVLWNCSTWPSSRPVYYASSPVAAVLETSYHPAPLGRRQYWQTVQHRQERSTQQSSWRKPPDGTNWKWKHWGSHWSRQ